ncbi:MAG: hypothetical protein ABIF17_01810 [Patescibacteria group bacterium]
MKSILKLIFIYSLIIFFLFFALELIKEGFVSNHFDLNIVLIVTLISGFILLIINFKKYGKLSFL